MSDAPIDRRRVYLMRHAEVSYFDERVLAAWNDLATRDAWRNLLLVAHDAVNRVVLTHVTGVGLSGLKAFEQDPACVIIIEIDVEGDKVSHFPERSGGQQ